MSLFFPFLVFLISTLQHSFGCPASNWIQCATQDNVCRVPELTLTTIAFGDPNTNQWTFIDVSNDQSTSSVLELNCYVQNLGNTVANVPKVCCYNPKGSSFISTVDETQFLDQANWAPLANNLESFTIPSSFIGNAQDPVYVRYGANGRYSYRLLNQAGQCRAEWFGNPIPNVAKFCRYYKLSNILSHNIFNDFTLCGTQGSKCNLNVSPSISNSHVRLIAFGTRTGSVPKLSYRYVLDEDGEALCGIDLFSDVDPSNSKFCYLLNSRNDEYFSEPVGFWQLVASCQGCDSLVRTLDVGVSSDSTSSTTSSWSSSISQTISAGINFKILGVGVNTDMSVTSETSRSISQTMSQSFGQSKNQGCEASCSPDESNPDDTLKLYQWVVNVNENAQVTSQPISVFQCSFKCITGPEIPRCPLHECETAPGSEICQPC